MSTLNKVYDIAIIGSGSLSQVCAVLSQHYELDTVLIKANENESKNLIIKKIILFICFPFELKC